MVPTPLKQRKFYGWLALAGAMLAICSTVGSVIISFGIFLPVMSDDLGWIVMGFLGPLSGVSVVKFGPRKNMIIGNTLIVLGALGMSLVREVWQVYLFYSLLMGAGQAFGSFIAANSVITNWFIKKRALVISLLSASGGVGGLIFAPLLGWFVSTQDWRHAWIFLAGAHFLLAVVACGLLVRNNPEDMGQAPDGEAANPSKKAEVINPAPSRVYHTPVDWRVGDALRTPAFWLTIAFASATMFTLTFLTLHQVAYLEDLGYTPMTAATATGVLGCMTIVGQLASGALSTRYEVRYVAAVCIIGLAAGITILMNARILPLIYLHTIISGISCGGIMVVMPILFGAYFGRTNYARILGFSTPVTTIFSAGSPLIAAYIFDSIGSYTPVFIIGLVLLGVGLVCAILDRPPKPGTNFSGSTSL
jgi:MFS family permease